MTIKTILTPVIDIAHDGAALAVTRDLAQRFDAHPTALIVAVHLASEFSSQAAPLSAVLEDLAGPRTRAVARREAIIDWLSGAGAAFEVRDVAVERAVIENEIIAHARLCDLVVMTLGPPHDRAHRALFEDIVFRSGRGVLLLPAGPAAPFRSERVMIAWDASTTAVRAVTAALPLLRSAAEVNIVTVDASPSPSGHARAPGRDLAAYLAHHGVASQVHNRDGLGREAASLLRECALDLNADLLIMGAYRHMRAAEIVFGGVTRDLLRDPPLPLIVAH